MIDKLMLLLGRDAARRPLDLPHRGIALATKAPTDPGDFIELATEAGRQAGVRQVIQTDQAGPTPAGRPPPGDSIVVGDLPHDWLFPRLAAVVHHAGVGTTAAGLCAGEFQVRLLGGKRGRAGAIRMAPR